MPHFDAYLICTSPRSGSTLLCDLLTQTGVAGNPASWFHTASVADWLAQFDLGIDKSTTERATLQTAFNAATAAGSANGGLFGLRLQRHSTEFFFQQLMRLQPGFKTDRQRLTAAFGRTAFMHLTRRDKVRQAVSIVRAEQTGLWHRAADGSELERLSPPRPPEYDSVKIAASHRLMKKWDRDWEDWFAREEIDPLIIEYESLAANPNDSLRSIFQYLQLDPRYANNVVPGVAKLGDELSNQWVQRFREGSDGG